MSPPAPGLRVQIAAECGDAFLEALVARLAALPVTVGPIDGSPVDVAVVGGRDADADVRRAVAAGVRWIQTLTAGVERVLGPALAGTGVVVTNGAAATARPVSEFAMARVLEHAKALPRLRELARAGVWETQWLGALAGATMTVVGLGPVGTRVARLARAFEVHVIGVRRDPARPHAACNEVLGADKLAAAAARSDYLVLAPALTPETRHLVSAEVLGAAKHGVFLVNVGRGELIDDDALLGAVATGRVTAALDVFADEPLPPEHPYWRTAGIAVSPHTATLTPPLIGWMADMVADNIGRFVRGEPLESVVDAALGYPAARPD